MQFYRGTGCHVILVGLMNEMPTLSMDRQGEYIATMDIFVQSNCDNKSKHYGVVVFGESALHLRRYAFPGLYLWIEGNLYLNNVEEIDPALNKGIHIVAEKIKFLPNSTEPDGAVGVMLSHIPLISVNSHIHKINEKILQ